MYLKLWLLMNMDGQDGQDDFQNGCDQLRRVKSFTDILNPVHPVYPCETHAR